jgi:hypothetical protein
LLLPKSDCGGTRFEELSTELAISVCASVVVLRKRLDN